MDNFLLCLRYILLFQFCGWGHAAEQPGIPAETPADDASRRLDSRPLIVGYVSGQLQNDLDGLMPVKTMAPRIDTQVRDLLQLALASGLVLASVGHVGGLSLRNPRRSGAFLLFAR